MEHLHRRISTVFNHLEDVEAIFLFNNDIVDKNFFYVSGLFDGVFDNCGVFCERNGRMFILTSTLEEEASRAAEGYAEIVTYRNQQDRDKSLGRILSPHKRIGIPYHSVSHAFYLHLKDLFGDKEWLDAGTAFKKARMIKSHDEIEKIKKACEIVDRIAECIPTLLKEGMTELDLSAEIDFRLKREGAQGPAFKTIAAFGKNSSKPHYSGARVPLKRGDLVLVDFGAEYNGYCSDITRTYLTAKPDQDLYDLYSAVLKMQKAAIELIRAGTNVKHVEDEVRTLIDGDERFRGRFIHSLGHSLGLDVHDGSYPDADFQTEFSEHMVLTVEPGIYLPGVYGVRIEDDIVVGRDGCTLITSANREPVAYEIQ